MFFYLERNFLKYYKTLKEEFNLKQDEPMADHTSFKVGGTADLFACPCSVKELKQLVLRSKEHNIPVTLFGSGTNILVMDKGIRGLVICLTGIKDDITIKGTNANTIIVTSSSGTLLSLLGKFAMENGLNGLNFAAGIPGTVGGAVMMNSSTGSGVISNVISSVEVLNSKGEIKVFKKSDIDFLPGGIFFKFSECENNYKPVILRASFELKRGNREKLRAEWYKLLNERAVNQPVSSLSAGCFFKNPDSTRSAGELIDMAGLKGEKYGNAMVSEKHANFIVNAGGASANDILSLKKLVEQKVFKLFSIHLKAEVKIEGE